MNAVGIEIIDIKCNIEAKVVVLGSKYALLTDESI
jgi:hypothetical protein